MSRLRDPFEAIVFDLAETMKHCRETVENEHYARQRAAMAIVRKYEIALRPVPLNQDEIDEPPSPCPVCRRPITGNEVAELKAHGRTIHAHPTCVNFTPRQP